MQRGLLHVSQKRLGPTCAASCSGPELGITVHRVAVQIIMGQQGRPVPSDPTCAASTDRDVGSISSLSLLSISHEHLHFRPAQGKLHMSEVAWPGRSGACCCQSPAVCRWQSG